MDVSSVHVPGARLKLALCRKEVTGGKVPRGWNSTGPPRASTMATPYIEPRIRDVNDMIGAVIMILISREAATRKLDFDTYDVYYCT